jgi:hypothetical protein
MQSSSAWNNFKNAVESTFDALDNDLDAALQ